MPVGGRRTAHGWRAFVGDSDAFSVSGQVTIEVRDLAERPLVRRREAGLVHPGQT
jgi:hypothetical protein